MEILTGLRMKDGNDKQYHWQPIIGCGPANDICASPQENYVVVMNE